MQAVILAAGKGSRMKELTKDMPKQLLEVGGRSILEHTLSVLPKKITRIVIVTGYLGEKIRSKLGDRFGSMAIEYVEQQELNGTAGALWQAKSRLDDGEFMVMGGDDWFEVDDLAKMAGLSMGVKRSQTLVKQSVEENNGFFVGFAEEGYIQATGAYMLNKTIFRYEPKVSESSGEMGLPTVIKEFGKGHKIKIVEMDGWLQINTAEQLAEARQKV